jgi:cytochrome c5
MSRAPRMALPRFCLNCGTEFAMFHHRLCSACHAESIERAKVSSAKRSQRLRDRKAGLTDRQLAKHESDRIRSNPANFTASNRSIKAQIAWMERNDLLPDHRRDD